MSEAGHLATIHELTEIGRQNAGLTREGSKGMLAVATEQIREDPWLSVVGAVLTGMAIAGFVVPPRPVAMADGGRK